MRSHLRLVILLWESVSGCLHPVFSASSLRPTPLTVSASCAILLWSHITIFTSSIIYEPCTSGCPHGGFDYSLPSHTSLETCCESMIEVEVVRTRTHWPIEITAGHAGVFDLRLEVFAHLTELSTTSSC